MSPNLVCQSCGYENDPTRVFCQNCGIRLARPADEASENVPPPPPPTAGVTQVRSTSPDGAAGWKIVSALIRMVISSAVLGALLAVAILVWRKPVELPETSTATVPADKLWEDVKAAAAHPYQRSVDLPEALINAYLAQRIQFEDSSLGVLGGGADSRFMLRINDASVTAILQTPVAGGNKYLQITFRPVFRNNGLGAVIEGGAIGRLSLPPGIARHLVRFMRPAINALQPEIDVLAQAESIDLNQGMARVVYGARP